MFQDASSEKKKSQNNIYMYIMIPFMEKKNNSLLTITLHINRRSAGLLNGVLTVVSSGVRNGDPGVFV